MAETALALAPGHKEATKLAAWPPNAADEAATALAVARADLRLDRPYSAERVCRCVLRGHRDSKEAMTVLADIRRARGDAIDPIATLADAVEADPESLVAREQLALRLFDSGQSDEANTTVGLGFQHGLQHAALAAEHVKLVHFP